MIRYSPFSTTISLVFLMSPLALAQTDAKVSPPKAAPLARMFPFLIPWDDDSKNATDVSYLNPAPLQEKHRITTRGGHFYDQTGRRVRFLGANLTFGANFPDKADAEKIAARMHKFGFNMMRLHHMDGQKAPWGLWDKKFPDLQHLDAEQLDKLDYFVAQMKKNGVYVDLNLHVARKFTAADGFPEAEKLPHNGKVTAWFEPRMVELQRDFAREMLTHRNPYTGLTYGQDPAVALIEIQNEDSLLDAARDGQMAELPDHYKNMLLAGWNRTLGAKYKSTDALLAAWNANVPDAGKNLLLNSRFADGTKGWELEQNSPSAGRIEVEDIVGEEASPPGRAFKLTTTAIDGTAWHLQINQGGLDLKDGQSYTLKFQARSAQPRKMTVYTKMDQPPWNDVGMRQTISLTPRWKSFELTFRAKDPIPQHSRLTFVMGESVGEVWLADLQLSTGYSLQEGRSLEQRNLGFVQLASTAWGEDFAHYLMDLERAYADGFRDFIKKDLGARGLVTCSQASYGGIGGVWRESKMDFVDMHAYWQHPSFPGTPWDSKNWLIRNIAMVSDGNYGTLPSLSMNRVADKPFTVSEYNHPAPNSFNAETLPLIISYAVWQDWDGIFLFDYNADSFKWRSEKIDNYFSVHNHPGIMAFMPAAAALFLQGAPPQAPVGKTLDIPVKSVLPLAAASGNSRDAWKAGGVTSTDVLASRLAIQFVPNGPLRVQSKKGQPSDALQWKPTQGQFKYTAPLAQMAISKGAAQTNVEMGDWSYRLSPSNEFAALALFSRDGKAVRQSGSLLLTVVGSVENSDMGWNAERTSVGDKWGRGPVLAEGISADIALKTGARNMVVYALDSSGARLQKVAGSWKDGQLRFAIGPQYKTLWYEITTPAG
jgi:hypothetical protein